MDKNTNVSKLFIYKVNQSLLNKLRENILRVY